MGTRAKSAFAAEGRSGELHVIKNCNDYTGQAGSYCTIASSNLSEIAGARVFYDQAFGIPNPNPPGGMLDSNVLLYAGTGDWAVGPLYPRRKHGSRAVYILGLGRKARRVSGAARRSAGKRREELQLGRSLSLRQQLNQGIGIR